MRCPSAGSPRRILVAATLCAVAVSTALANSAEFFENKIRPILAEKCFKCHSAGAKDLKGNLLLDSRAGLLKGGETGPAIVAGRPEQSLLITVINDQDPDTAMPPKKAGGALPPGVRADFAAWIQAGAPWPESTTTVSKSPQQFDLAQRKADHWCWQPPALHRTPTVKNTRWARTLSDGFLLAKLEEAGLMPALPADRGTLLRRVTFDLTGLPPSAADLARFLADDTPNALESVVDRLLASPQFGERWARHWLDLIRYAESRGHESDFLIPNAWQYRDYVVRAFNNDVPYHDFVKEHIAGDLLPARLHTSTGANESVLGTGFWFFNEEVHSPVDLRQDELDRIDNRVDVMTKSFLGLTVACARCHDHKFDAISQKDYYALTGFLISSSQRLIRFETIEQESRAAVELARLRAEINPALLKAVATALHPALAQPSISVLSEARCALATTAVTAAPLPEHIVWADYTRPGADPFIQDGAAFGPAPTPVGFIFPGSSAGNPIAAIASHHTARRDETWKDLVSKGEKDHGLKGIQRSGQTLRTREGTLASGKIWYLVRGAGSAYAVVNSHLMVAGPLHGKVVTTWQDTGSWQWVAHNLSSYPGQRAHLEVMPAGSGDFEVAMIIESPERPALPAGYIPVAIPTADEALAALLIETHAKMASGDLGADTPTATIASWLIHSLDLLCPPGSPARLELAKTTQPLIERHHAIAQSFQRESHIATAMFDGTGADEFLLKRGSQKLPLAPVPRRFLEAIAGPTPLAPANTSGRKELAEIIGSTANPLTSRVIVNRVWHHLFGKGIVPTVDNFGALGQAPSHPELLDTLAVRFATEQRGSLKTFIRELVLSSAYAMSSRPNRANPSDADPDNTLLHHMNLKRLEGEAIRDAILAVAGTLNSKMGGVSVPVHLTAFMTGRGKPTSGPLDGDNRRSLYLSIRRNFLSPMMLVFDMPIPFSTMGRRNQSNVPAQSLMLMNDPFVFAQAVRWAERLPTDLPSDKKLEGMYLAAFARPPGPEEMAEANAFIREQASHLAASLDDPRVWADLAHVLFNAKEFIYLN